MDWSDFEELKSTLERAKSCSERGEEKIAQTLVNEAIGRLRTKLAMYFCPRCGSTELVSQGTTVALTVCPKYMCKKCGFEFSRAETT
ncbi:MAG: hypothetical protein ACUVTL_01795 [Thermoproteota archaeon]